MTPPTVPRRSLLHGAWAAPVIVVAGAAPVFAASVRAPTLEFFASSIGDGSGYGQILLEDADGRGLSQVFEIQGLDPETGVWQPLFRPSTVDGYFASTLPAAVVESYSRLRVVADVPGFGRLTSSEVVLPFA